MPTRVLFFTGFLLILLSIFYLVPESKDRVFKIFSIPNRSSRVLFVGDIMLDRTVRREALIHGYDFIFSCAREKLHEYDAVVANLEGPVTSLSSVSLAPPYDRAQSMQFTFAPESISAVRDTNIAIVSIGNNHIYDFGREGITETEHFLNQAGILFFGNPENEQYRIATTTIGGTDFSFVVFNEFFGTSGETIEDIREEKERGRFVIVYAHWGDEYVEPPARVKTWARQFVDAGADLVVGAHPHVVQESEIYNGVPIYYSLGNFVFDQYFLPEVQKGLALEIEISDEKIMNIVEHEVKLLTNRRTCFAEDMKVE